MPDLTAAVLSDEEIRGITGYKRPGDQLAELKAQGFYRARLSPTTGDVILERPHYNHICAGGGLPANDSRTDERQPRVRA